MSKSRLLTEAELMVILWNLQKASVREVVDDLDRPRAYTSIATILRILQDKGSATWSPDSSAATRSPWLCSP